MIFDTLSLSDLLKIKISPCWILRDKLLSQRIQHVSRVLSALLLYIHAQTAHKYSTCCCPSTLTANTEIGDHTLKHAATSPLIDTHTHELTDTHSANLSAAWNRADLLLHSSITLIGSDRRSIAPCIHSRSLSLVIKITEMDIWLW